MDKTETAFVTFVGCLLFVGAIMLGYYAGQTDFAKDCRLVGKHAQSADEIYICRVQK